MLAGSGVLVAGTVAAALVAQSHDDTMQQIETKREQMGISADELARYHHETSQRDAYRDAAYVAGGAAIVTGAVAAALYFFDTPHLEERAVVPTATSTSAGVSFVGRW